MLNAIGADWEPVYVDFFKAGVQRTPEYREKINEMGEAPALVPWPRCHSPGTAVTSTKILSRPILSL
jgi:hypothetical protein